jgi:hypothetical protein
MKAFERIFLYSVLAILVFYVFLVDNNVESQVAIQEEIRARSIVIVNDAGRPVVALSADKYGNGIMGVNNKSGTNVVGIAVYDDNGGVVIKNKDGIPVAGMVVVNEYSGEIGILNKDGTLLAGMGVNEYGDGGQWKFSTKLAILL